MSAAVGAVAVIFRQTNIVWIIFFTFCVTCNMLVNRVMHNRCFFLEINDHTVVVRFICSWLRCTILKDSKRVLNLVSVILLNVWPYCIVFLAFMIFFWINDGIVVGARRDHEVAFHFPQLLYFAVFAAWFASVHVMSIKNVIAFVQFVKRHLLLNIFLLLMCFCAIWRFTYVHRYVLADNRHYTFYVWSWLFARHPLLRYAFVPLYLLAGYLVLQSLALRQHFLWCVGYVLSVTALLVPTTLLEFRYYIVPYIIFRLNISVSSLSQLVAEFCMYAVINALTIYIFLHRPFYWNSEVSLQRFMW